MNARETMYAGSTRSVHCRCRCYKRHSEGARRTRRGRYRREMRIWRRAAKHTRPRHSPQREWHERQTPQKNSMRRQVRRTRTRRTATTGAPRAGRHVRVKVRAAADKTVPFKRRTGAAGRNHRGRRNCEQAPPNEPPRLNQWRYAQITEKRRCAGRRKRQRTTRIAQQRQASVCKEWCTVRRSASTRTAATVATNRMVRVRSVARRLFTSRTGIVAEW